MSRKHRGIAGFTLIELLIVVAIIAILAAIAVPNFLEAQTRSKVSRVKSDMRTVSTSLESYIVDWGKAPLGPGEMNPDNGAIPPSHYSTGGIRQNVVWMCLTTPVAYLSSIPLDPFVEKSNRIQKEGTFGGVKYFNYQHITPVWFGTQTKTWEGWLKCSGMGVTWLLNSYGPSRRLTPHPNIGQNEVGATAGLPTNANQIRYPDLFYDASNGTMSFGHLIRSQKGIEPTK